jgi:hypothetical protein
VVCAAAAGAIASSARRLAAGILTWSHASGSGRPTRGLMWV